MLKSAWAVIVVTFFSLMCLHLFQERAQVKELRGNKSNVEDQNAKMEELQSENKQLRLDLEAMKAQAKEAPTASVVVPPAAVEADRSLADAESGFASIVKTAYERALEPVLQESPRKKFDVAWWTTESGLTTTGGLDENDRALLGQLYYNASSVFEYGLGESTYIANYVGVPRYAGIDSDPVWVGMARDKVAPHFRFYLGDIGQTRAWGYPTGPKKGKSVLNYQLSPLIVEPQPFDVYMVDGRWRLPAMIASFLHASDRGAPHSETIVCIHDCQATDAKGRVGYKRADHLLKMVQHSGSKLCVYQRRQETTDDELKDLWHTHMDQVERRL